MRISLSFHYYFLFLVCLICPTAMLAQSSDSLNEPLSKLINSDIASIQPVYADSVLINGYLKNTKKCLNNRNDSALFYANLAIKSGINSGLVSQISIALQIKGEYFLLKENFTEATSCFIHAIKIEEKLNNESRIADLNDLLGTVYYNQEIFAKSLEYNQKALTIYQNLKDTLSMAKSYSHIASLHISREYCEKRTPAQIQLDKQTGIGLLQQAIQLFLKKGEMNGVASGNVGIGYAYNRMGKPEIGLTYVEKALAYYREKNDLLNISNTMYSLGFIYNRLLKFDLALQCFKEAERINLEQNEKSGIQFLYEAIAQTYDNLKEYKNSRDYYVKYMILRDSVYNNEKSKQVFEMETKYQSEKKQHEIEELNLIKKQRTRLIYFLSVTLFLVSLFSWMYYRNIRNEKIIAHQKLEIKEKQLVELEKERQLLAAKSVLEGEEAERSRLAGDLHDGLGGLLTGVKLKLSSMKENVIMTSDNLANFNHALDLLDTSISEMRRVAHNLMPETLMHYGLKTALNDFIKQVESDGIPVITFNTFGGDLRYEKELEITVYRISQELITNSLKHSQAIKIDIQMFTESDRVCIEISDNGSGFDPSNLEPSKTGKGLKNIRDRVTAFNGRFEILSQPGKGTETIIEFLIS